MKTNATKWVRHLSIIILLSLTQPQVAQAETFHCSGGNVGCLIAAIMEANANGHRNTIRLEAGTYTLGFNNDTNGPNALPSITSHITIKGAHRGTTILERQATAPDFRLAHVAPTGNLILDGVTFTGGSAGFAGSGGGGAIYVNGGVVSIIETTLRNSQRFFGNGGAIYNNAGTVRIIESEIRGNRVAGAGGAVFNNNGQVIINGSIFAENRGDPTGGLHTTGGTVDISGSRFTANFGSHEVGAVLVAGGQVLVSTSTFDNNLADGPGAINVLQNGTLIVTDSAFVSNLAEGSGIGGAIFNRGTTVVTNTTFARNAVDFSSFSGRGSAVANQGRLALINSTLAENIADPFVAAGSAAVDGHPDATTIVLNTLFARNSTGPVFRDCTGTVTSFGHNLFSDTTGCNIVLQSSDRVTDAGLGAFTDNGKPGNAHFRLLPGSPAIDAANSANCLPEDQLGNRRRGRCDIGAIEFQGKEDKEDSHRPITGILNPGDTDD